MSSDLDRILKTREKLGLVSPSFCLAKWLQVTLHLQNGHTHSCHHPNIHKVPIEELRENPSALHNTKFKKLQRKDMLEGKRPSECGYCWTIEDTPGNNISDRYIKSNDHWAAPRFEEAAKSDWQKNINPSYVEVSFSNICNLKCAYCAPHISSKWAEEIRQFGPYKDVVNHNDMKYLEEEGKIPIPESEPNPYIDAFWKWWPDLVKDLKVFRITGGEPLLSRHTFKVLDFLKEHPQPALELAVNSNLSVPFNLIEKFAASAENLVQDHRIKNFRLFTSIDTFGEQAEYIRYGLNYSEFIKNLEYILQRLPSIQIVFMCTFNALSITAFRKLMTDILRINKTYASPARPGAPVFLDISYLRFPSFLNLKILTPDYVEKLQSVHDEMVALKETPNQPGFSGYEIAKMSRMLEWMKTPNDPETVSTHQKLFYNFVTEYDRRRNTSFVKTFPEMKAFFEHCKSLV